MTAILFEIQQMEPTQCSLWHRRCSDPTCNAGNASRLWFVRLGSGQGSRLLAERSHFKVTPYTTPVHHLVNSGRPHPVFLGPVVHAQRSRGAENGAGASTSTARQLDRAGEVEQVAALEPVLLAHVLHSQPAQPPDALHVLLLLPEVQPLLQTSQVSGLRELLERQTLRVICSWVHYQVHLQANSVLLRCKDKLGKEEETSYVTSPKVSRALTKTDSKFFGQVWSPGVKCTLFLP